ncbi:unnamed protein product [Ixodes pacificus]
MATEQCPARALGTASSNTSMARGSQVMVSAGNTARVLVHFHSFSWVEALFSSMTRGTQPPKTNMRWPMRVAECRLRGSGARPSTLGLLQLIDSTSSCQRSPRRQPLMPPYTISRAWRPSRVW